MTALMHKSICSAAWSDGDDDKTHNAINNVVVYNDTEVKSNDDDSDNNDTTMEI